MFLYDYLECMNGIKLSSQFKLHILFLSSVIQCSFTYQTCYHLTKSVSGEKSSLWGGSHLGAGVSLYYFYYWSQCTNLCDEL